MNWYNSVWLYCERGTGTALLAEPVNAASNIMFFFVAIAAMGIYRKLPQAHRSADHLLLIMLTLLVGLGNLSFHLFANQWSELLHMLPLILFMVVFLAFALNKFADTPPGWTVLIVGVFVMASLAGLTMACGSIDQLLQPSWSIVEGVGGGATSCLNGSAGYIPTLLVLAVLAIVLCFRQHKAAPSLKLSTLLFSLSLVFLAIDHLYCNELKVSGYIIGTHFIWHGLNALVLFILLRASMIHQNKPTVQEIIPPEPKRAKSQ